MHMAEKHALQALRAGSAPYAGARGVLSTMHGKEAAIAPVLSERLDLIVAVPPAIDTDALGTFTGDIPRAGTMREAAIAKARLGMAETGLPIGLASEGSYGPQPHIPFMPGGVELLVLVDDAHGIVVTEHLVDKAPVFDHTIVAGMGELSEFLRRISFPEHALIVKPNEPEAGELPIHKGLRSRSALGRAIADSAARSHDGRAFVQTDMRAHMNPTRMAAIGRVARKLCDRLATPCLGCGMPGFGLVDVETGLPCEWCGAPSIMVHFQVLGCVACDYREKRPRADGRTHADPGHCPECNP
jgi:hypothetical protein